MKRISFYLLNFFLLQSVAVELMADIDESDVLQAMAKPGRLLADINRDNRSRPEAIIPLLNLELGDSVVDIFAGGGYYSELLASVVGDQGEVFLHNSPGFESWGRNGLYDRFASDRNPGKITRHTQSGINLSLNSESLDGALIVMAIHDLYVIPKRYNGEEYVPVGNSANTGYFLDQVFASLKPGGRFVIVDHQGNPESSIEVITDLHRIDETFVRSEVESHGFVFVDSSNALRTESDDRDRIVFDEDIQGKTDRFVIAFEKPIN